MSHFTHLHQLGDLLGKEDEAKHQEVEIPLTTMAMVKLISVGYSQDPHQGLGKGDCVV